MKFSDEVVEAAALAIYPRGHHNLCRPDEGCSCYFRGYRADARAALSAAGDAMAEHIRAEALAPVAALGEEMVDPNRETGTMPGVRMQVRREWAERVRDDAARIARTTHGDREGNGG
jgi:hypothetical protein